MLSPVKKSNSKQTKQEKEEHRIEALINHAKKSKDKYVYEIFDFLEKNNPGCVILVNEKIYHKRLKSAREVDILTNNYIIEIKSGKVRHKTRQFLDQQDFSKEYNKGHIVYAPEISDKKYKELSDKGINVIRSKNELLKKVKK